LSTPPCLDYGARASTAASSAHADGSPRSKRWLLIICSYFGRWPPWINFFVESCKWNPDVCWRFYTDCGEPANKAANIEYVPISFADYKAFVSARLGCRFDPPEAYKLCDLRPALGFIHEQDVADYSFFGYGDVDVIFGNISQFYDPERLSAFDVISTHPERISGHFAVFRNRPEIRCAFERIENFRSLLQLSDCVGLDETQFAHALIEVERERCLFVERYSTVLSPRRWHDGTMNYPQRWFWQGGRLTNEYDGQREFLYLHFMRWQSARWINDPPAPGEAAWVGRDIIHLDWHLATGGFCICPEGITPIRADL
jgi:hypothetical protein